MPKMYVKFVQSRGQRDAGISASIVPLLAEKRVTFKSRNSINLGLLDLLNVSVGDELLVDVTERQNDYTRGNGEKVTGEWQLSVNVVTTNEKVANKLMDKFEFMSEDVSFAEVSTQATPARIGNALIETAKTVISQADFDAKIVAAGTDVAAIAKIEAMFDVQF
jgi:uncharacterized protein (DUF2342 family)